MIAIKSGKQVGNTDPVRFLRVISEGRRFGPIHCAFRVDREDLDAAVAHVCAAGVEVSGPMPIAWMTSVSYYFSDPDGNLLEWWSPHLRWVPNAT